MSNHQLKEKLETAFSKLSTDNERQFTFYAALIIKGLHAHTCLEVITGAAEGEEGERQLVDMHYDTCQVIDFLMEMNDIYGAIHH